MTNSCICGTLYILQWLLRHLSLTFLDSFSSLLKSLPHTKRLRARIVGSAVHDSLSLASCLGSHKSHCQRGIVLGFKVHWQEHVFCLLHSRILQFEVNALLRAVGRGGSWRTTPQRLMVNPSLEDRNSNKCCQVFWGLRWNPLPSRTPSTS